MTTSATIVLFLSCVAVLAVAGFAVLVFSLLRPGRQHGPRGRAARASAPAAPSTPSPQPTAGQQRLPYRGRQQLLTRAELTFFDALKAAVPPQLVVYPQMRLASIVDVEQWAQRNHTHFNRIQAKCVDFVLCDAATTAPRLVVELDDSSHNRADRMARDAFVDQVLASANIPILHVRWQRSYDAQDLARQIGALAGVAAPSQATWATPIPVVPQPAPARRLAERQPVVGGAPIPAGQAVAEPAIAAPRYVCGQCQREVRREAKFCNDCGAVLS